MEKKGEKRNFEIISKKIIKETEFSIHLLEKEVNFFA